MDIDIEKYREHQFCDNKSCKYHNKVGQGNIGWNSRKNRQVYCKGCGHLWVLTKDTFFYHLKTDVKTVLECLLMLSEGSGVNATCRVKGVTDYALRDWVKKAGDHMNEISIYFKQDMKLVQCQIDEFWSFILKKKALLTEDEKELSDRGDRWTFVNVLPGSGFIQATHHGKRTEEETQVFIKKIKQSSNGAAPLFLSDGFAYTKSIVDCYCTYKDKPYKGIGRPEKPLQIIDPNLKYAQVVKHKEGGRLTDLEIKIIFGKEEDILQVIQSQTNARKINTSYVESRNGNYRKDNKRLTRRTQCHSKKTDIHDNHIDFLTGIYNFCTENKRLKKCINKNAKRFETKYSKISAAMAEGLVTMIYSLEEILMMRVPS